LLAAALEAQTLGADGVDLNLGCPQARAREGNYGSWLAADPANWPLIASMVRACSESAALTIPITVKIRLQVRGRYYYYCATTAATPLLSLLLLLPPRATTPTVLTTTYLLTHSLTSLPRAVDAGEDD